MYDKSVSEIRITSANVNGFNNLKKRAEIMINIETSSPDIIFLCDTRFNPYMEQNFRNEIDYHCFFNSFDSTSRGVAILVKKSFPLKIMSELKDDSGNRLSLICEYDTKSILLTCVYGPNRDDTVFFTDTFDFISSTQTEYSIIGGDFNTTLNHNLDNEGYIHTCNPNSRKTLNNIMGSNAFFLFFDIDWVIQ